MVSVLRKKRETDGDISVNIYKVGEECNTAVITKNTLSAETNNCRKGNTILGLIHLIVSFLLIHLFADKVFFVITAEYLLVNFRNSTESQTQTLERNWFRNRGVLKRGNR